MMLNQAEQYSQKLNDAPVGADDHGERLVELNRGLPLVRKRSNALEGNTHRIAINTSETRVTR